MKRFTASTLATILTLLAVATSGRAQMDAAAKLKPIADAYVKAWNTGEVKAFEAIVDQNFVRHTSPSSPAAAADLDSLKRTVTRFRAEYPDFHVTLTEEIYTTDKIAVRWQWSGTHSGVGLPAAQGKKVQSTGMSLLHVKNGKIAEEWVESDGLATVLQLGFTVTPPAK